MARTPKAKETLERADPDRRKLTELQAARLAAISGESAEKLVGRPIGQVHEALKWRLDPGLLLFRRVCGCVGRRDPATGELEGVPNATVHVADTDCSFLFYSPPGWPYWTWLFPFHCKREVIATAVTDACGRFCVWVPAWEIDWVIRWRRGWLCFPTLWRPRLHDWIERVIIPELERPPGPPRPEETIPITIPQMESYSQAMGGEVSATPIEIPGTKHSEELISNLPIPIPRPTIQNPRSTRAASCRFRSTTHALSQRPCHLDV